MKRKPDIVPHLSTTEKKVDPVFSNRRRGLVPSQTTLSVQDVKDYTTPQGASMANEEMRRLRLGIDALQQKIPATSEQAPSATVTPQSPIVTKPDDPIEDKDTKWALTLFENNIAVNDPMVVQGINFVKKVVSYSDRGMPIPIPIVFKLTKEFLESKFQTQNDTVKIKVVADAVTNYIDWYFLLPQGRHSVQVVDAKLPELDEEGLTVDDIIPYGIFKGMNKKWVHLLNDEETPDPEHYYGTDDEGFKGWHPLPSNADQHFHFVQDNAQYTWLCQHNLNKIPSVMVIDSNGVPVDPHISYVYKLDGNIDLNNIELNFVYEVSGDAYFN